MSMQKLILSFRSLCAVGAVGASMVFAGNAIATDNVKCPLMIEEDVDDQEVVEWKGYKILMCCTKCTKAFEASEAASAYYAKVATELGLLPNLKGKEKELGFDDIQLLDQRFSVISHTTLITPESPTVEYNGKTYHVFDNREVSRWNRNPEAAHAKALAAGVIKE